ncbi:Acetamidase/formamidase [Actinopolymorpha cephalotaxi]|uniref:Acetamidase/formamidase n=1 Tax=Actinopolymorpha cephalotaxi TaxID=504797 RepID=A0A1I2XDV3_9ACTN|nr:acetamidase/formamidase family protein [Actinopolymorpha cephalotaxi]NYH86210.1 acetamidase/formamidase [Actinopolymorpha cephalotaxi]SFH11724.1 Acetamidase/formamidase [Actinopolymorpha cephalotaxi]
MQLQNHLGAVRNALVDGLGRREFLRAATALSVGGAASTLGGRAYADEPRPRGRQRNGSPGTILQPHKGPIHGRHYLASLPDQVRWGYVPAVGSEPVLRMRSGETLTVDTISHEGILEDQGRDPVAYFAGHGVSRRQVLDDAVAVARDYSRTSRDFDVDGPHVITGPVHVDGAEPGDVLEIEMLSMLPRVPYGVVSSRHGKGALPRLPDGGVPPGITLDEIMPPVATDGRATGDPTSYGNVSTFTPVRRGKAGSLTGVMPVGRSGQAAFPLHPFMGAMGVAFAEASRLTDPVLNSIPPTLGGGNIDINLLGSGARLYLPVFAEGALFFVGDPHLAMGNGEVALTAMEGSLRSTFRLTVRKAGKATAPSVAYRYPFAETPDAWVPVGLSDPDGVQNGQGNDLDIAMRRAVVNALDFLEHDRGMDRPVAYAYLSAAANFEVSQVVDKTVGVHGVIQKAHFDGHVH